MTARPCLVGEANPHSADPRLALYVKPRGAAGSRLAAILGLAPAAYLRLFSRRNLYAQAWDLAEARIAAARFAEELAAAGAPAVLLGGKVARAFGVEASPFARFEMELPTSRALRGVLLPHPSGRCRVWNDPASAARARVAVSSVLVELELGAERLTSAGRGKVPA